ncbi:hypothetical protein ACTHSJ_25835 [Paenibacillus cellulositrophicus]|uniref:hypothetical protein n=1 Tax=Paenibacillus cellulositrophicus TaxID=562959 RepID=UPI003F7F4A9C
MSHSVTHNSDMENNIRLIVSYQMILIRQLDAAYKEKLLDEVSYQKFKGIICTAQTQEGIYDHFNQVFKELAGYYQTKLQSRIVNGAKYLDSIWRDHPKYPAALKRYDELCQRLQESKERERGGT